MYDISSPFKTPSPSSRTTATSFHNTKGKDHEPEQHVQLGERNHFSATGRQDGSVTEELAVSSIHTRQSPIEVLDHEVVAARLSSLNEVLHSRIYDQSGSVPTGFVRCESIPIEYDANSGVIGSDHPILIDPQRPCGVGIDGEAVDFDPSRMGLRRNKADM